MTEKTQKKFIAMFMAAVMLLLSMLLTILAANTVASVNRGQVRFLESTVEALLETPLTRQVKQRYAQRFGICILSEEVPGPSPEGMPVALLLEKLEKSAESFSVKQSSLGDGTLVLWSVHQLRAQGKPYYGLRMTVSDQEKLNRAYTILAPRKGAWEILCDNCWLYLLGWLAMGAGVYLICRNLVRRIMKPVERAWKGQQDFTAAAAHELKAPLAVIQASVEAAEENPETVGDDLNRITAECARLARLSEELLELAARDAGGRKPCLEDVNIDSLLIDAWERERPVAAKAGLKINLQLSEEAYPTLTADRMGLEQVLHILLDNAISYSPSGTEIELSADQTGRGLTLCVADHGPGIPQEHRSRVTQRFFRGDPSRTDKNHFGLGLSIAGEIIQQHGYSLSFSETPGGGCTARLEIPWKNQAVSASRLCIHFFLRNTMTEIKERMHSSKGRRK